MSDTYHYEDGAIHHDHKKVLHIDNVNGNDVGRLISAFFKDDVEEAVIVGEEKGTESKTKRESSIDTNARLNGNDNTLSANRQAILDQLLDLTDKGDWVNGITSEQIKAMLKAVLGIDENLSAKEAELSEVLWHLLESGRGDRVKIVWQNMVGYLDDKKLFQLKGSPALNKDFFGDDKGYTNIDKGRPSRGLMTADFESIIPLLDAYVPKLEKKA